MTATSCADYASADPATQLKSVTRTSYDGQAWGAVPTRGLPTSTATPDGKGACCSVVVGTTYDPLGRPRKGDRPAQGRRRDPVHPR
ncbi:hypothetical protein [Streptomyces sp. NBC_01262]|uniref:hypothetical protein n=1 Tax=Streptomyces sp. NBC_01262 TaxID=2903803 RepID=UPI002E330755|nr:hypothetical protein [Streptomyces sp. NBC_01262]